MPAPDSGTSRLEEEWKSDSTSSSLLYDIIHEEDGITVPMDAVKDEMVQKVWKIDSPLVKVRIFTLYGFRFI